MRVFDSRRVLELMADKGGPAGADDGTRRHHNPPAASATSPGSDSDSPALSAATWQPLPSAVPKRRRVGTSPTTGSAAPPRHPPRRPTEATTSARGPAEHPDVDAAEARSRRRQRRAPSPKPSSAAARAAPSRSSRPLSQKTFVKRWTQAQRGTSTMLPPASIRQGFLAQLAFAGAVIMGIRGSLNDLLSGWNQALKVIFLLSLIMGVGMLAAGLMAASTVISTGYTRTVLSTCARFCTCLAAFMLIVDLSVFMGSRGYIVGTILGVMAVLFTSSVWIKGDPVANDIYMRVSNGTKNLWGCFKRSRERGPILPI